MCPRFIGVAMMKYPDKKHLREEEVCPSPQFQVTVHQCREDKAGATNSSSHHITVKSRDKGVHLCPPCLLALI